MIKSQSDTVQIEIEEDILQLNAALDGKRVSLCFTGEEKAIANAIFRSQVLSKDLPTLRKEASEFPNSIVIGQYISTEARQLFRDQGLNYLDSIGNIFFQSKDKLIFVEKNRNASSVIKQKTSRAFTKTGLKLLYNLLQYPKNINESYLLISGFAGVSTDTVSKVIKQLLIDGYLIRIDSKKFQWRNREKLFERWVEGYNRTLRPNLERAVVAPINEIDWTDLPSNNQNYWGGSIAANKYSAQLLINDGIMYTHLPNHFQILRENLWYPKEDGQIIIYEAFWPEQGSEGKKTKVQKYFVHPFIIYADLINSNDPRQIEVAQEIYEKEIEPQL